MSLTYTFLITVRIVSSSACERLSVALYVARTWHSTGTTWCQKRGCALDSLLVVDRSRYLETKKIETRFDLAHLQNPVKT